jgi:ADP-ribosylation factor-like protein 8|eukprot:COSAG01_NODE_17083_length_1180_cov_1.310823_2_plen_85_part_00
MPLLVLGNKIDLEPHMSKDEIIKGARDRLLPYPLAPRSRTAVLVLAGLNLDYITDQPWECMAISGLRGMGVERVIDWLIAHARK